MIPETLAVVDVSSSLFPRGFDQYLIGGALIGIGVSLIFVLTAIVPGSSTFLESALSYVSGVERFAQYRPSRSWRNLFTLGMISGGAIYALLVVGEAWTTEVQWWRLLAGGFLVGVGTRIGKGCTTGHGICGIASRSSTSIVNVLLFMGVGIITATVVNALGVLP